MPDKNTGDNKTEKRDKDRFNQEYSEDYYEELGSTNSDRQSNQGDDKDPTERHQRDSMTSEDDM